MTTLVHLRLIWPNRPYRADGDELTFDDGQPAPNEAEMQATQAQALALWAAEQAANNVKQWPTVAEFWDEFSVPEQLDISASGDDLITLLRTNLAMWRGAVHANHPQIVQGVTYLRSVGILTEGRVAEVLT